MSAQFKPGDRVRVIDVEGYNSMLPVTLKYGAEHTVEEAGEHLIRVDDGRRQFWKASRFEKVEPEFTVGQPVSGDDYDRLPVQARAVDNNNDGITKTEDRWVTDTGKTCYPLHPRILTHLPDATEPEDKDDAEPEPLKEGVVTIDPDDAEQVGVLRQVARSLDVLPGDSVAHWQTLLREYASSPKVEEPTADYAIVRDGFRTYVRLPADQLSLPNRSTPWALAGGDIHVGWGDIEEPLVERGGAS